MQDVATTGDDKEGDTEGYIEDEEMPAILKL